MSKRDRRSSNWVDDSEQSTDVGVEALMRIGYGLPEGGNRKNQSVAIAQGEDGNIQIGAFRLTPVGLVIDGEVSQDEWFAFYTAVRQIKRSLTWIVADWLAYGDHWQWGEKYTELSSVTGYKEGTLREYAYVARNVNLSTRIDKLSFKHHHAVAGFDDDGQRYWLHMALENKWSVSQMMVAINNEDSPAPSSSPLTDKINRRRFNKIWRNVNKNEPISLDDIHAMRRWLDELENHAKG